MSDDGTDATTVGRLGTVAARREAAGLPGTPEPTSLCASDMRDYGYVDARGMGVRRKIVPLIRDDTGSEPVFEASDDRLRTTLPAKPM